MVKKFVMVIDHDNRKFPNKKIDELLAINCNLNETVTMYKNKITPFYKTRQWDRYKKVTNEYETIHTSPPAQNVCKYSPISRAFFKMWEILCDFSDEIFEGNVYPMKFLCLAESPGSFVEAVMKYRFGKKHSLDEYHGISLKSKMDKNIPDWRYANHFIKRINLHYGADGTGNLYNIQNIIHLTNELGENSQSFISGDGGFDFSTDFNGQELSSLRLISCEILCAILLQREGGCFVLKIFDTFNESTIKILQILYKFYEKIFFIKPLSSRPANSEKYLLCTKFSKNSEFMRWTTFLKLFISNYEEVRFEKVFQHIEYDINFYEKMCEYNLFYSIRQIYYIQRTIEVITNTDFQNEYSEHERKCLKFCRKYKL